MALFATAIQLDVLANRPAASTSTTGRLFASTDTDQLFRDNGTGWDEILVGSSVSGISGSTGATDNALLRANGTGGSTLQSSGLTIDDSDTLQMAGNIIDQPELRNYSETLVTANTGAAYTVDVQNGNVFELTLTDNVTYTFSNPPVSGNAGSFTLIQKQDATGSRTVTWPSSVQWSDGAEPTLTSAANSVDIFTFLTTDGGTTWYGFTGGQNFS